MSAEQVLRVIASAISFLGFIWALLRLRGASSRAPLLLALVLGMCVVNTITAAWTTVGGNILLMSACFVVLACYQTANRAHPRKALLISGAGFVLAVALVVCLAIAFGLSLAEPNTLSTGNTVLRLCTYVYATITVAASTFESYRAVRGATRAVAVGLHIAALGQLILVCTDAALAIVAASWLRTGRQLTGLYDTARMGMHIGSSALFIGLISVGGIIVYRGLRHLRRAGREYRELEPLWTLLHHSFPDTHLRRRAIESSRLRRLFSPRARQREYYRRTIECWDGLVRVSAFLPTPEDASDYRERARGLISTVASLSEHEPRHQAAAPVLEAAREPEQERQELLELSRAIAAEQRDQEKP